MPRKCLWKYNSQYETYSGELLTFWGFENADKFIIRIVSTYSSVTNSVSNCIQLDRFIKNGAQGKNKNALDDK